MVRTRRGHYDTPIQPVSRPARTRGRGRVRGSTNDGHQAEQDTTNPIQTQHPVNNMETPPTGEPLVPPQQPPTQQYFVQPPMITTNPYQTPYYGPPVYQPVYFQPMYQNTQPLFYQPPMNQSTFAQPSMPMNSHQTEPAAPPGGFMPSTTILQTDPISNSTPISTAGMMIPRPKIPKLTKFSDEKGTVDLRDWLVLFEHNTSDWTDEQRAYYVVCLLEGEALGWFSTYYKPKVTWSTMKQSMMTHFCEDASTLLSKAWNVQKGNSSLVEYFRKKSKMLAGTQLTVADKINCMNEGLPSSMKQLMRGHKRNIHSMEDWFHLARSVFQEEVPRTVGGTANSYRPRTGPQRPMFTNRPPARSQPLIQANKPNKPCIYCKNLGKPNEYHWHSQCANNPNRGAIHMAGGDCDSEVALNSDCGQSSDSLM